MRRPAAWLVAALVIASTPATAFEAAGELPATGIVQYAFTPGADAAGLIVSTLREARSEIYLQAFIFTHRGIAAALVEAAARGVHVEVIADKAQFDAVTRSVIPMLAQGGVTVYLDAGHAAAHDKVILIDPQSAQPAVVTGSFNLTWSAQHRNAENVLVLKQYPALARAYLENWLRHRAHAAPYNP
ncbi:MAG TPA: phospholipase D-like domain-containing protein [Burkholderiales bacterium]|nr:phospholipase D-like domain-containing protein [Burkholderiales bacterium]